MNLIIIWIKFTRYPNIIVVVSSKPLFQIITPTGTSAPQSGNRSPQSSPPLLPTTPPPIAPNLHHLRLSCAGGGFEEGRKSGWAVWWDLFG